MEANHENLSLSSVTDDSNSLKQQLHRIQEAEKVFMSKNGSITATVNGMNGLTWAAMKGDKSKVIQILRDPLLGDPNVLDSEGMAASHWAAKYNEYEILQTLLADHRSDPNVLGKRKTTPLHQAAISGSCDAIRALLEDRRVQIDAKNEWEETPLMLAIQAGNKDICELLLRSGADVSIVDKWSQCSLEIAASFDEKTISQLLIDHFQNKGREQMNSHLTENTDHLPSPTQQEDTLLHPLSDKIVTTKAVILSKLMEAPLDEIKFSSWLADPNIDVLSPDFYGMTPMHKCCAWDRPHSLLRLLQHQQMVKVLDEFFDQQNDESSKPTKLLMDAQQSSPLLIAAEMNASRCVSFFFTAPPMIPLETSKVEGFLNPSSPSSSPSSYSRSPQDQERISRLGKLMINFPNESGVTPLYHCVLFADVSLCELLLNNGADPFHNVHNSDLRSPYIAAVISQHLVIVDLFRGFPNYLRSKGELSEEIIQQFRDRLSSAEQEVDETKQKLSLKQKEEEIRRKSNQPRRLNRHQIKNSTAVIQPLPFTSLSERLKALDHL